MNNSLGPLRLTLMTVHDTRSQPSWPSPTSQQFLPNHSSPSSLDAPPRYNGGMYLGEGGLAYLGDRGGRDMTSGL